MPPPELQSWLDGVDTGALSSADLERHGPKTRREFQQREALIRALEGQIESLSREVSSLQADRRQQELEIARLRDLLRAAKLHVSAEPVTQLTPEPSALSAARMSASADAASPEASTPSYPPISAPSFAPATLSGPVSSRAPVSARSLTPERYSFAPPSSRGRSSRWEVLKVETQDQEVIDVVFQQDTCLYSGLQPTATDSGVFVATYRGVELGTRVSVHILTGRGVVHVFLGVVRWSRATQAESPPGLGIAFVELSETDVVTLNQHFQSEAPLYFEV